MIYDAEFIKKGGVEEKWGRAHLHGEMGEFSSFRGQKRGGRKGKEKVSGASQRGGEKLLSNCTVRFKVLKFLAVSSISPPWLTAKPMFPPSLPSLFQGEAPLKRNKQELFFSQYPTVGGYIIVFQEEKGKKV